MLQCWILCRNSSKNKKISPGDFPPLQAKGNIPTLAYHSALFYKKELFVFGGVHPGHSSGEKSCSNALYIFNPEFELWYQPIVEGDKPLPRFGSVLFPKPSCSMSTVTLFPYFLSRLKWCLYRTGTRLHFSPRSWWYSVAGRLQPTSMISTFSIWVSADLLACVKWWCWVLDCGWLFMFFPPRCVKDLWSTQLWRVGTCPRCLEGESRTNQPWAVSSMDPSGLSVFTTRTDRTAFEFNDILN